MIIVINETGDLTKSPEKLKAINNILLAYGEGKHVLWMPAKKIESLISSNLIHGYQLQVLHELKENSRLAKASINSFDFSIEVDFTGIKSFDYSEPNKITISYSYFTDSASVQPPIFVAENLSDVEFYELGGKVHLRNEKLLGIYNTKFRKVSGGGNPTIESFEYHLNQKDLILCILDSDKKHPKEGAKDTASRFSSYKCGWGQGYWLHILECTEAENLVPWAIAKKALEKTNNPELQKFSDISPAIRKFLDHKKGISIKEALELDKTQGEKYWEDLLPSNTEQILDTFICGSLGNHFLDHSIDLMKSMTIHKLSEAIDNGRDSAYLNLSRMVASWGVCLQKPIR